YYVSQTINGCESATRTSVSVTLNVTPAPTASAQTFCNFGTVADLVATGTALQWYSTSTGGIALASTTNLATGTYYVSQTINGCESATRTSVSVTLNVTPAPTASAQTFCNFGTVADLVATGTALQWYSTSTGGIALASTTNLATGTYYVSQTLNSCESATRTAVSVTLNVTPAPTASAQTFCNFGTVADLVATGTALQWYSTSTGGIALASTTNLATGTYYVSQTLNSCESATRTAVSVTLNVTPAPTASAQTFCNFGTVADLVATGTGTMNWYSASTGGIALVSTTNLATGTYYVSQTINGCESATRTSVSVTLNVTPVPTASAQTFCNFGTVADLVATGSGLKWYAASTGGTALVSTTNLATGTYYVSQTINGCESATRTSVSVTLNVTPAPTASAQTFCNFGTVADLVATGTALQWYSTSTGGIALASTTNLATGTYYVSQTINGCESATRTSVSVTLNVTPAPTASAQTFCNVGTVADLVATGTGTMNWYSASTGGTALVSTTNLATRTYYVSQTISGCESATRTAVDVTISIVGLIRQHWRDVIFFDNSSNEYVSYQWFKNDELIVGENKQFLKENGDLNGVYFAKVMTISGIEVTSCSLEIVPNNEIRSLQVIPNPNPIGQLTLVKMNLSAGELIGAKLYLFSITGELLNVINVTGNEMQIQVPSTQGVFPLKLQLLNGDVLSVNIAVK
ncbi:hypothetical protein FIA58_020825, partial [Flavobacterium jejuense]|nr:hypothetical protein [Flavobacterium jejuense]